MATNSVLLLMLSATCRPLVVSSITHSLMLLPTNINMIEGKLTRPEIQFIWVFMKSMLHSCHDLYRMFVPHTTTSSKDSVPTIIYSGTQNRNLQVMKVVNESCARKNHKYNPCDGFIQCFHSATSRDSKKIQTMYNFSAGKFPLISATMALGLSQNLKRVQCVIHMGRGDPSSIVQMVGRCGWDGNTGLGILFMKPT
jgi:superfamily II DNA helicase RecQ